MLIFQEALQDQLKDFQSKLFSDYRKMLDTHKDIELSQFLHLTMYMYCKNYAMERNKHVYVQKPITHNIREARILTELARKQKVVIKWVTGG